MISSSFILKAPAKINWFLIVKGLRDDGYHKIVSLMQRVSVYDEIQFETSDSVEIITNTDIPLEDNLINRAVHLLKAYLQKHGRLHHRGARIRLNKEIPIAAGLGGGSSDAATTLIGLNILWGLNLTTQELMNIGALIGSDVPFFLGSPAAVVKGRGEVVYPVKLRHSYPVLLVKPPVQVETKWAYSEFDRIPKDKHRNNPDYLSNFLKFLTAADLANLNVYTRNDLEDIVIKRFPEIATIKETLRESGAIFSIMSGSGPTVIAIFDSTEKARQALKLIPKQYWCRLAETLI